MRIVSVLIHNFFEVLVTESEIFLSLLVKSLEVDKANWQRSIALEALYRMINPAMVASLCRYYDMKPDSSKILRDIVNALCIYIQSQFQVVDSTTTTSLLTSLVNNTNSGNPSVGFIGSGNQNPSNQNRNNSNNNSSSTSTTTAFPVFSLRGISISLLFIPSHKIHRYRTFYIDQLDQKAEPPAAPEGHGLSTALACILQLVSSVTSILEEADLEDGQTSSNLPQKTGSKRRSFITRLGEETRAHHEKLLSSVFGGLTGTFSLLLDASTDEVVTELLLEQMRKLIALYGLYGQAVARDALLLCMSKSALPANYYSVPALSPYSLELDDSFLPPKQASQSSSTFGGSDSMASSATAANTAASHLSLSSLSQYSLSNAAINLPNLLSQQNSAQSQAQTGGAPGSGVGAGGLVNPNNPIVNANIMSSMDGPAGGGNGNGSGGGNQAAADFSRQIIAVGTAMPSTANSGTASSSTQAAGPVMLTSKNLQCMNSLLAVSNAYGYVYEESSWHIVLTALQHLVWILGLKPNSNGVYRLGGGQKSSSAAAQSSAQQMTSVDGGPGTPNSSANQQQSLITSAAMSDLPMLTSMLSRLFECTQ